MSGLCSERLKSWKEEKEEIVKGSHAALGPAGDSSHTCANRGSHQTCTLTIGNSTTGSRDEEGTERSTDTQPFPSVSGRPELQLRRHQNRSWVPCTTPQGASPHTEWNLVVPLSIWLSLVSTPQVGFRTLPHENVVTLWSDTLHQQMQTVLGGPL